jgi:hypothetical protein
LPDAETIALVLFGRRDDIPVMGDWSGSATLNIDVFRNGQWLLDSNGRGVFGMAWPMFIACTPSASSATRPWRAAGAIELHPRLERFRKIHGRRVPFRLLDY